MRRSKVKQKINIRMEEEIGRAREERGRKHKRGRPTEGKKKQGREEEATRAL